MRCFSPVVGNDSGGAGADGGVACAGAGGGAARSEAAGDLRVPSYLPLGAARALKGIVPGIQRLPRAEPGVRGGGLAKS